MKTKKQNILHTSLHTYNFFLMSYTDITGQWCTSAQIPFNVHHNLRNITSTSAANCGEVATIWSIRPNFFGSKRWKNPRCKNIWRKGVSRWQYIPLHLSGWLQTPHPIPSCRHDRYVSIVGIVNKLHAHRVMPCLPSWSHFASSATILRQMVKGGRRILVRSGSSSTTENPQKTHPRANSVHPPPESGGYLGALTPA